ncbi:helix-turn-helix domain-containing protein [Fusobacterium mortiferum]|uniref:helix-turn-helix domain-containing protein n=1 Tax=Fusobacterium mortiferum TaxID=850 RepID=UPI003F8FBA44
MNIINQEEDISLKISSKLEYLIKVHKVKAKDLANFIGITEVNFSRIRNRLKEGKFPTFTFIAGISKYFNTNFFEK